MAVVVRGPWKSMHRRTFLIRNSKILATHHSSLGVVQKLRGQDEVGRWLKNASFCHRLG